MAINRVSAEQELDAIERAVNGIFDPEYRLILIDKYLLTYPKTDCDIYTNLGYEKSQYYNMLDNALMSFSELYKEGVLLVEKLEKSWN
ncbi:hypothetical protein Javan170_0029 [Streptococcus phage Javan170]|nr:hypothetical protein Javan170_0029 [Streptococcus phage Javan170]